MKINWKDVSKNCAGYRSLKNAYIDSVKSEPGSKEYYHNKFMHIIRMAQHVAIRLELSCITSILNTWESRRTYCWINYYQHNNILSKIFSGKPSNVKPLSNPKSYIKDKSHWADKNKKEKFRYLQYVKTQLAKKRRVEVHKKKARWGAKKKHFFKQRKFQ